MTLCLFVEEKRVVEVPASVLETLAQVTPAPDQWRSVLVFDSIIAHTKLRHQPYVFFAMDAMYLLLAQDPAFPIVGEALFPDRLPKGVRKPLAPRQALMKLLRTVVPRPITWVHLERHPLQYLDYGPTRYDAILQNAQDDDGMGQGGSL